MKTAIEQICEYLQEDEENSNYAMERVAIRNCIIVAKSLLDTEKQQHEQTAINITNVLMDALDNPKGGKFSLEDEFNKYWDKTYNV